MDISTPTAPVHYGKVATGAGAAQGLVLDGTYVYEVTDHGLYTIDASNPASPVVVGSLTIPVNTVGIAQDGPGGRVFTCPSPFGVVSVFNVAPGDLPATGNLTVSGTVTTTYGNRESGKFQLASGSTTQTITLPETTLGSTTQYHVTLSSVDATLGLPAAIRVTARTATTFTLTYTITAGTIDCTYSISYF